MPSRKYRLIITDEADDDFTHILSHTERMWGDRQVDVYGDKLDKAIKAIGQNPEKGKTNLPPYRYVRAAEHVVFYIVDDNTVYVSRILHSKMDFVRHLEKKTH